jgi:short subunit dehydrogenase-like uncharacterized protein
MAKAKTPAKTKSPAGERPYDLVVYGATSFVGKILVRYLHGRVGSSGDVRWAIAGRDAAKLAEVKQELGAPELPVLLADAGDAAALRTLAGQARVIVSTVGPYALYGSALVAACAESGTDYCDLTGEVPWMRQMIAAHEATAKRSGARIVHTCGFDSIPSDLGVWFTQREAQQLHGEPCIRIKLRVKTLRGGISGGTAASMVNIVKAAVSDPELRALLQDPYALIPEPTGSAVEQPEVTLPEFDADADSWLAPFIMAAVNSRVVQRSHALQGYPWGPGFQYDEAMLMGRGLAGRLKATGLAAAIGSFVGLTAFPLTRPLVERFLPRPGEGPSPQAQERGGYDLRFYGRTASGRTLQTKVTGDRDPGYGSTARMLGEAALCLAQDMSREQVPGGFWTPSTAMGEALLTRLVRHAGLRFERV